MERVSGDDVGPHPHRALEGLLALVYSQGTAEQTAIVFEKLEDYSRTTMADETLLDYLRVLQLALIRDPAPDPEGLRRRGGPRLLARFPGGTGGSTASSRSCWPLRRRRPRPSTPYSTSSPRRSQEEQIHTAYALRSIRGGWTPDERRRMMAWFDRAWTFRGAASMEGYVNLLWESMLERLTDDERTGAEARRQGALVAAAERAAALAAPVEGEAAPDRSELAQMSFEEMSEYLEYDPMSYSRGDAANGRRVFYRARCVSCHVFGTEGRAGGPTSPPRWPGSAGRRSSRRSCIPPG